MKRRLFMVCLLVSFCFISDAPTPCGVSPDELTGSSGGHLSESVWLSHGYGATINWPIICSWSGAQKGTEQYIVKVPGVSASNSSLAS